MAKLALSFVPWKQQHEPAETSLMSTAADGSVPVLILSAVMDAQFVLPQVNGRCSVTSTVSMLERRKTADLWCASRRRVDEQGFHILTRQVHPSSAEGQLFALCLMLASAAPSPPSPLVSVFPSAASSLWRWKVREVGCTVSKDVARFEGTRQQQLRGKTPHKSASFIAGGFCMTTNSSSVSSQYRDE